MCLCMISCNLTGVSSKMYFQLVSRMDHHDTDHDKVLTEDESVHITNSKIIY